MSKIALLSMMLLTLLVASCSSNEQAAAAQNQAIIYHGGDILTMEGDTPIYVQALVEQQGKIVFVGDKSVAMTQFKQAKPIDLQGKALLPGFIDGHSHVHGVGFQVSSANLLPSPDGEADSVEALVSLLKQYRDSAQNQAFIESSGWIIGFGYDDAQLDRYPTADDLDRVSIDKPVIIVHTSGHLSVLNNKGLVLSGITAASKNPTGGHIRRKPGTQQPNGVLEETAHFKVLFTLMGKLDDGTQDAMLVRGQEVYASYGYTTAQEGRATEEGLEAMIRAAKKDELLLDIVAYQDSATDKKYLASEYYGQEYNNQFRIAGIKLSLDGSPQGKTAWLTHPYHIVPEGLDANYKGYATFADDKAADIIANTFKNNWQILVHANGDAAIDQFIASIELATQQYGNIDRRPVLIHGQTLRQDQIKKLVELKIFPSLFPMHTFYWGDWHAESVLGHPRADAISPTKSVLDAGLMFTSHHDAPVARPDSFRVIDATVNRTTRTGKVLGPEERVSVYIALKAMTEWAAYQHFEEGTKGTLSVGKQADFILLDQNPLKINKQDLQDIKVVETIKAGKTVFKR
ncbi:MAG: amidohydrolase [Oleispira sp.]|nr:amidohydrolase [Oleispira sp.]